MAPTASDHVPAVHLAHARDLDVVEYLPLSQAEQEAAISMFDALPGTHSRHAPGIVRARSGEYMPTPHAVHAKFPLDVLNVPAGHSEHILPFSPWYPGLHLHALSLTDEATDCELVRQCDFELSMPRQKKSAVQELHAEFARKVPAIHTHASLLLLLGTGLCVFGRKSVHSVFMPLLQYDSTGHGIHSC